MTKKTKAVVDTDIARKIWLAGVGAYGRVLSETQDMVGKLAGSANETFDQLVARGEEIEDTVRARIAQTNASERVVSLVDTVRTLIGGMSPGEVAMLRAHLFDGDAVLRTGGGSAITPIGGVLPSKPSTERGHGTGASRKPPAASPPPSTPPRPPSAVAPGVSPATGRARYPGNAAAG